MSANSTKHSSTPGIIWKYSSTSIAIGKILLILFCSGAGWFCYSFAPVVMLILGFFCLMALLSLIKYCWVTVEVVGIDLVYTRKSIFRKQKEKFPASLVIGVEPKEVRKWNQQKIGQLFLVLPACDLLLSPFYERENRKITNLREELLQIQLEPRKEAKKPRKKKKTPPPEDNSGKMIWTMIEMGISCLRCDSPVMVNGPFTEIECKGCGETIDFNPSIWADLLEDTRDELVDMDQGEGSGSTIWGTYNTSIKYGRLVPYCSECKKDYIIENDYSGGDVVTCSACGKTRPAEKPPEWFNSVFKGVQLLIGVSHTQAEAAPMKRDLYMTCPSCGASILVSGKTRNEKCSHCDSPVLLPDELWEHLHPVPIKTRWFVGFIA